MRLGPVAVLALLPIGCGSEQASEFAGAPPANDDATLASTLPALGDPCTPGDTFDCTCKTVTCPTSGAWDQDCADCPDCPPCSLPNVVDTGNGCPIGYFGADSCGCCFPKPAPPCTSASCCDAGSVLLPTPDAAAYVCESCRRIVGGTPDRDGDCSPGLIAARGCCLPPSLIDGGADASDQTADTGVATVDGSLEASSDAGPGSSDATPEASLSDASADAAGNAQAIDGADGD